MMPAHKSPASKALLVGINRYKLPGADLQGCINDVTGMRDCLLKLYRKSLLSG